MIWLGDAIVHTLTKLIGQQCTNVGPTTTDDIVPV